ncbi:tRNA glutamyl-Q(34) synthetase GluQRS [Kaarinaea lacus]
MSEQISHDDHHYIGRFAPSPTGPLHFGSLVCAVASFLQARNQNGQWLVRMEDLDPPREQPGAADGILRTLERYGLYWDSDVVYQSKRRDIYEDVLRTLSSQQAIYHCACSRKDIALATPNNISLDHNNSVYPETCREGLPRGRKGRSVRVKTEFHNISFDDQIQGEFRQNLRKDVGDFVLKRADGFYAYQLAVVVDDALQNITEIVRGCDLLDNTPRQIHLQQLLGFTATRYAHIPVVTKDGNKLSKQTYAEAIGKTRPVALLCNALEFLGHAVPKEMYDVNLNDFWSWAITNWQLQNVPKRRQIEYEIGV